MPKENEPEQQKAVVVIDVPHAPVIYFDGAPNFGNANGVVNVTLAVARHLGTGGEVTTDALAVAHLRCTIQAAVDLRNAIDKALLIGAEGPDQLN